MPRCRPTHKTPNFNLHCWGWVNSHQPHVAPHDVDFFGQLVPGIPGPLVDLSFGATPPKMFLYLYVSLYTRLTAGYENSTDCWVQIDPPLGRIYRVFQVDQVAEGYKNEFRFAVVGFDTTMPWELVQTSIGRWTFLDKNRPTT
jgi:hypothetical protein